MPDGAAADADTVHIAREDISPDRKVAFLRRIDSYPEHPARVEIIETHFSWVFLTETRAYKLKKPVKGDGFDFRSVGGAAPQCDRRSAPQPPSCSRCVSWRGADHAR